MYHQRIQDEYTDLSPSYRRVADFVVSRYYDVAFMTAAQLAAAVEVDTTTVVRFSQRLGYPGYPELLQSVRSQVKEELYAVYEPVTLGSSDPAAIFKAQIDQESANLRQILIHNPPGHLQSIVRGIGNARRVVMIAEGELEGIVEMTAARLRRRGLLVEAVNGDPGRLAYILAGLAERDVVIGVSSVDKGICIARSLSYAHALGCRTYAVVGRLDGPLHRWADEVLYAPCAAVASRTGVVALTGALMALCQAVEISVMGEVKEDNLEAVRSAYHFLTGQESVE